MKKVLISIHPQWCEKIFSGEKTIEVRKSRPSLDMPFKVLVYETKAQFVKSIRGACTTFGYGRGKVIGSFICDRIFELKINGDDCGNYWHEWDDEGDIQDMCLFYEELETYLGKSVGHGWHITEPKLFDKPKELSEFMLGNGWIAGRFPVKRAPQSWMYVEEM